MTREEIIDYVSKSYQEYAASINYELGVGDKKFFVQCSVYGISPKLACQILKIAEKEERNALLLIYERSADLSEVIAENGVAENIKTSEWFNAALSIMESYPSYAGRVYVINLIAEISEKDDYFNYADLFNALNNKEDITYLCENLMRRRNSRKKEATKAIERKIDALEQKINNLPDGIANRQLEEENNSLFQKNNELKKENAELQMKRDDLQEQLHNEEAEKLKQESESRFNNLNEEKEKIESEKIKLAEEKGKLSNEVELLQKKNKELEEKLSLQQRFITANSKSIPAVPQGAANPVSAVTDFIKPKKFKKWRTSENAVEDAPQQQPEKSPEEIEFEKKKREIDEKLNLIQLMQQHNFHAGRIKAVNDAMAAGVPMPTLAKLVAAEYEEQDFIDFLEVLKIKK